MSLTPKKKSKHVYRERTFLISESKGQYWLFLGLTVGSAAVVYLKTLCQTVTVADAGELITACYTLGVAHWPGYPLYVLLGNMFINLFNIPDPAFTVNLMSAFFGVLTLGLLYAVIYHFTRIPFLSASVALLFGWGATFWSVAVIAEVYTLHTFMVALVLFLVTVWIERRKGYLLYLIPFLMGLACTDHQLAALLVPAFIYLLFLFYPREGFARFTSNAFLLWGLALLALGFFLAGWSRLILAAILIGELLICLQQDKLKARYWLEALGCFIAGLLLYLYLPIRASVSPSLNWGNPDNLKTFLQAVLGPSGSQAEGGSVVSQLVFLFNPIPGITVDTWPWTRGLWLFEYLSPVFFLFGLWGIGVGLKTGWRLAKVLLFYVVLNVIVIIGMSHPPAEGLFKVDVYYLQAFMAFAIFIGVGVKEWIHIFSDVFKLKKYSVFGALIILIVLTAPLMLLYKNYPEMDRSNDTRAYNFSENMISSVDHPADSILLVNKDDLFILWYFDKVLGHVMPVYPLVTIPGMPAGEDYWLGWYNRELEQEDAPRVLFPLPTEGDKWLTPEDSINAFIHANTANGKNVYFSSLGFIDVNIDINAITYPVRPYKAVFKVLSEEEMLNQDSIVRSDLEFWRGLLASQAGQMFGYFDSPGRRPGDEFMISRYAVNLYQHASWASRLGMQPEAAEFCSMSLRIYPYFEEGLDLMTQILTELGDYSQAEIYLNDLLRTYPDYYGYHLSAARFYSSIGRVEKALDECETTLRLDPGNVQAQHLKTELEGKSD